MKSGRTSVQFGTISSPLTHLKRSFQPKFSKRIDPNIQNLLKKLLIKDPVRRPTIYEVVDHKWFDQETRKQIDRFEWRPNFIPTLDDLGDCRSGIFRTRPTPSV